MVRGHDDIPRLSQSLHQKCRLLFHASIPVGENDERPGSSLGDRHMARWVGAATAAMVVGAVLALVLLG